MWRLSLTLVSIIFICKNINANFRRNEMIYFNQTRLPLFFATKDGVVFEVNSNKKPEELLETLLKGEDISEIANIVTYLVIDPGVSKFDPKGLFQTYNERDFNDTSTPNYDMSYNEDYDGDYDQFIPARGAKSPIVQRENMIFKNFESVTFGVQDTGLKFQVLNDEYFDSHASAKAVFRNLLIKQLAASCDIAPYLLELYPEASIKEYKELSRLAEMTYDDNIAEFYSENNDAKWLPKKEGLDVLKALTKAERSLFETDNGIPTYEQSVTKVFDKLYAFKTGERTKGHIMTLDEVQIAAHPQYQSPDYEAFKQALTDAFNEEFHFVPRVIDDFALAYVLKNVDRVTSDNKRKEYAEDIVKKFSRQSLAKIAKTGSLPLYALCTDLNMNEVKQEHIDIIAVFYPVSQMKRIDDFIEYYKKYKDDLSEDQLKQLLSYMREYDYNMGAFMHYGGHRNRQAVDNATILPLDKTPAEIIEDYKNVYAVDQKNKFAEYRNLNFEDNDLAIEGRNIEVTDGTYTMKMLQKDDLDLFVTGRDTNCCTSFDNAGETCVQMAISDPLNTFCAIYSNKGRMLVSAYTWVDIEKDTLVFDNMEFHNDARVTTFEPVISKFVELLPYKNVHVGTGYNTGMSGWGKKLPSGSYGNLPKILCPNMYVYSDYHESSARALKLNGQLCIKAAPNTVRYEQKELVPSRYDEIMRAGMGYLLSTGKTLEEITEINAKIENGTISQEEMKDLIIKYGPSEGLMAKLPVLSNEMQLWFMDNYNDKLALIKEPCDEIAFRQIERDPKLISKIDNPSEALLMMVVRNNGLYLSEIKSNLTYAVCKEAVTQNGYAYSVVPAEFQSDELKNIAVTRAPRIILSMNDISEETMEIALSSDPSIATLVESITGTIPERIQMTLADQHPSALLGLENISMEAMRVAVERNGLFIRNCYRKFPELIDVAIRQNPQAIGLIPHPSVENVRLALSLNPNVAAKVRDPEILAEARGEIETPDEAEELCLE